MQRKKLAKISTFLNYFINDRELGIIFKSDFLMEIILLFINFYYVNGKRRQVKAYKRFGNATCYKYL